MTKERMQACAAAVAIALAIPLSGQAGAESAPEQPPELRKPVFTTTAIGQALVSESGESLGRIRDCVLDRATGRLTVVAAELEGTDKIVAVPASELTCDAEKRRLVLNATAEELQKLPAFEPFGDRDVAAEAGAPRAADGAPGRLAARVHLAAVAGQDVRAEDGPLGPVEGFVLDAARGEIAFVLVSHRGGDPYIVPWRALAWESVPEQPDGRPTVKKPVAALERAPTATKKDLRALEAADAPQREQIFRFWGVESPYAAHDRKA